MKFISRSALSLAITLLGCLGSYSAQADFFDDARQTFQSDIPRFFQKDVPHFFQDDIPCAFGGQPTSHTKQSCDDRRNSVQRPPQNSDAEPARPVDPSKTTRKPPVYDQ